jgi:hypothetical protein
MRRGSLAGLTLAVVLSVLAATAARTEGSPTGGRPDRVTEGALFWRTAQQEGLVPAPVLETDVRMVVTGIVARAKVVHVSPYTSLVAVDVTPVRPGHEPLHRHALATNLPEGWDYTAVFGLGQGATDGPMHVALGLAALLLAAGLVAAARALKA